MSGEELYWVKFAAIAQALGALATFAAVAASLYIAALSRRPLLNLKVADWQLIGGMNDRQSFVLFEAANVGHIPVRITQVGWVTGHLPFGPKFLRRVRAIQFTDGYGIGRPVPFDVPVASREGTAFLFDNLLDQCRNDMAAPMFTRDWPYFGRRATRVRAFFITATGHRFYVRPQRSLVSELVEVEKCRAQLT